MFGPRRKPNCLILIVLIGLELTDAALNVRADPLTVCPAQCDFRGIQEAIDAARPGDTIRVHAGTYRETLQIDRDLTIKGEGQSNTVIDGAALGPVLSVGADAAVVISEVAIVNGANGGIRNDGDLEIILCTVSDNQSDGRGGGVSNRGTLTIDRTTVCGNTATGGGGVFNEGRLRMTASLIVGNDVSDDGGGILSRNTCELANCTVSGNNAGRNGGGIAVDDQSVPGASTRLVLCTVADNVATTGRGSGIFNASATPIELASSIVAVNDPGRECTGEILSGGYNVASDLSCNLNPRSDRPDQHATNPLLLELGHNGGSTLTHALRTDSSAIDAGGDSSSCLLDTDQRGVPRTAGGHCDAGAYERPECDPLLSPANFVRGDADDDGTVNITDAITVLGFLFLGGSSLPCEDAGDADDNGQLLLADPVVLLNWLFRAGPPLPEPLACGPDPTVDAPPDDLRCATVRGCRSVAPIFRDLWTSDGELQRKPTSGEAWEHLLDAARDACPGEATVTNQDSNANVQILAAAIVSTRIRTVDAEAADVFTGKVIGALRKLVDEGSPRDAHGCPAGCGKAVNSTLAWGREVGAYVLAADLVGYRTPALEEWIRNLAEVHVACDGRTMLEAFQKRPNNWGVMNFGSLVAMYAYLGDVERLEEIRDYFIRGLNGDIPDCQETPDGEPCYVWGGTRDREEKDMTWHCDATSPMLIAPPCTVTVADGTETDLDGLIPDDQRRSCSFCPSGEVDGICQDPGTNGCIEPEPDAHISDWMNGAVMGARILDRVGLSIWQSGDQALKRMIIAHMVTHCQLTCDDRGFRCDSLYNCKDWILPILDEAYDLRAEFTPPPPTACDCPLDLEGRGAGSSKNAGFGAYIVR